MKSGGHTMKTRKYLLIAAVATLGLAGLTACQQTQERDQASRSVGTVVDDATISTRVKMALADDPNVSAMDVKVDTYQGRVQLSGFVDNREQSARAAELARNVPGVQAVKNDLRVKPRS